MIFTQIYATIVLPGLVAWSTLSLAARLHLDDPLAWGFPFAAFLATLYLGYEVEHHYFREVSEGMPRLVRVLWFVLGLPALYLLSFLLAMAGLSLSPTIPFPLAILPSFVALGLGLWLLLRDNHHRGRRLYTQRYLARQALSDLPPGDPGIPFGGVMLPTEKTATHVAVLGTTGSGKTTILKQLMEAIIPQIGTSPESRRCLIYDPKTEFFGFVSKLATCPVYSLHPFDQRGRSWNMCRDIRNPKAAGQFAVTLIPRKEGPNSYFSNGARALVRGVITSFILNSPKSWTFRDLILACETEAKLRAILGRNPLTTRPIAKYLDAKEKSSVLSELDTFLDDYSPIAACWSKAKPISLRKFTEGRCILLLAQDEEAPDALTLINGLMFRFVTQQLLRHMTNEQLLREKKPVRRTFLLLDELRDIAGRMADPLTAILTRGRAYGIACLSAWQSHRGMIDAVNENRAPEIVGLCSYLGMLRVREHETALYLSQVCGEREVYRKSRDGSKQLVKEQTVMPEQIADLPGDRLHSYFYGPPPLGLWKAELPWPERKPRAEDTPVDFDPRPDSDQYLEPWTKEDLERLNLPLSLLADQKVPANQDRTNRTRTRGQTKSSDLKVVDLRPERGQDNRCENCES
jgi:DNA segregation ATPase FtsK/SpoIIIE-like protein